MLKARRILPVYSSLWLLVAASCGGSKDSALDAAKEAGREACDRYIDCALEVAPESIAGQLPSYGPDGSCWDSDDAKAVEICTSACKKSRDGLGELFPDVGACGPCDVDADCLDYHNGPRCQVKSHTCVDCLEDGDCAAGRCNNETNTCVECLEKGDCDGGCNVETHTCVECVVNEDCTAGSCDEATQMCIVGCKVATDCPGAFCNYVLHVCVECYTDNNCAGDKSCIENKCV